MDSASVRERRLAVLRSFGAPAAAVEAVAGYCESPFQRVLPPAPVFPLQPEPHVEDWRRYAAEAAGRPFAYLQERLPQLSIPVREGISKSPAYGEVTRRGRPLSPEDFAERLSLERPDELRLQFHEHPAGSLPVLVASHRADFETLVRALAWRNEPRPISPAVNAQIVTGFINWERMNRHRAAWAASVDPYTAATGWPGEMARVAAAERWRYEDRFLITCVRPYSSVSAADLGLAMGEPEWLDRSTQLRIEHEFTHYATHRVYGAMSLNLLDETIADFMGTTYALGSFRAEWYLRFLGLEAWPQVRDGGRVRTYASELAAPAFELLCALVVKAAAGLERIGERFYDPQQRGRFLLALCALSLELLAAEEASSLFSEAWSEAGRLAGAAGQTERA